MQMLASTIQFSHNTPNQQQTPPTKAASINQSGTQKKGIMPQTPNNAPTHNQHSFLYAWTLLRMSQSTVSTLDTADQGVSPTRNFQIRWQQNTRLLNHQPTINYVGNPQLWVLAATAAKIKAP